MADRAPVLIAIDTSKADAAVAHLRQQVEDLIARTEYALELTEKLEKVKGPDG